MRQLQCAIRFTEAIEITNHTSQITHPKSISYSDSNALDRSLCCKTNVSFSINDWP